MESTQTHFNKKKIGVYSGSFNPIHIGHTNLAQYLIDNKLVEEVWFVISPCNPFKNKSELLDEYIRLDMLIYAIQGQQFFKASDVEFCMPIPSYSADTLDFLSNQYPEFEFSLIIGSDNALVFDQWHNYNQILNKYPILVYPRTNYNFNLVADKFHQMQLLNSPVFDISSTQIRHMINLKKDASQWLHPSVYQYIIENNLYV